MEITNKFNAAADGRSWVAEVTVNGPFNLQVEKEQSGRLTIEATCTEGANYCKSFSESVPETFSADFADKIYPKYLRITSYSPVQKAYIVEEQ